MSLAVTLCIMMATFSVSVRLCCVGVRSCLGGSKFWLQCKQSSLLLGPTKLFVCIQQRRRSMCMSGVLLFIR